MPDSLLYFGYALLTYNLSKKIKDILKMLLELKYGIKSNVVSEKPKEEPKKDNNFPQKRRDPFKKEPEGD